MSDINSTLYLCLFAEHVKQSILELKEKNELADKIRERFPDCLGSRFSERINWLKNRELEKEMENFTELESNGMKTLYHEELLRRKEFLKQVEKDIEDSWMLI